MTDDERVADAEARPINGHELLERLAALPVATWRIAAWEAEVAALRSCGSQEGPEGDG